MRLELGGPGLAGFASSGVPDEWVGLVVPGQFQSRYYTVRSWTGGVLTLDVVVHDEGLVTAWAQDDEIVGQVCTVTEPQASFAPPSDAAWVALVGDLTAFPAMARILAETATPAHVWAEVPDEPDSLTGYLVGDPARADVGVTWLEQPADGVSRLAAVVEGIAWPAGPGYLWFAGESAQMRAVRKHLRDVPELSGRTDLMGYWRSVAGRRPRAVDVAVTRGSA